MRRNVVVIGASAGGVGAISELLAMLPGGFPAAIGITIHRGRLSAGDSSDTLAALFSGSGPLQCLAPVDGQPFVAGFAYLAPPDVHMLLYEGSIKLERGPKEHHARPAVDPMFRSAAASYGQRVIGALLTGNLEDGTDGLCEIQRQGGFTMAQDPDEADFPSMPQSAIKANCVHMVVSLSNLGRIMNELVRADDGDRGSWA